LPLFLTYQSLAVLSPPGPEGSLRNGADVILQELATRIAGPRGPLILLAVITAVGLWLVFRDLRAHRDIRIIVFGLMLAETVVLAVVFGVAVTAVTSGLVRPTALIVQAAVANLGTGDRLMLSLGAGLYEELLFRVLVVGTLAWVGRRLLGWRPLVAGLAAALIGAVVFSMFHYVGQFGDEFRVYSFVFRTIAGLAFSALFLLRGFGITAWTHALYDVFLLLR
jgi:Type II CAAX prenyl endopeptidase Rce1-like